MAFTRLSFDLWFKVLSRFARNQSVDHVENFSMHSLSLDLHCSYSQLVIVCKVLESEGFLTLTKSGHKVSVVLSDKGLITAKCIDDLALACGVGV